MDLAGVLDEQLAYYGERAPEYDEWWERRGRYDRGAEANRRWFADIAQVRSVFDRLPLDGEVLELAPGTGYWTELLARRASHVTALDGSAEMLARNRTRLGALQGNVEHRQVDLFTWAPERRWDALVFCFWISHVPRERLAGFFRTCRTSLVDGATMFFLDGRRVDASTAVDHTLPAEHDEVMVRKLNDGREFRIVKNFFGPELLVELGTAAGFTLEIGHTDTYFQFGVAAAV
jgi:demethylmenaquinone methyltransferase/2-methoxy-6-polyprenyl-1,4-benzoquinol methylase